MFNETNNLTQIFSNVAVMKSCPESLIIFLRSLSKIEYTNNIFKLYIIIKYKVKHFASQYINWYIRITDWSELIHACTLFIFL